MSDPNERRLLSPDEYLAAQESEEFVELKRRFRRFAFPMTVAFLVWYLLFVLLSTYAHDFMSTKVFGNINVGLIFGLLQFVSTFAITHIYVRHANRNTDPIADEMRHRLETHEFAHRDGIGGSGTRDAGTTQGVTRA